MRSPSVSERTILLGVAWDASEKRVAREHGIAAVHTYAVDVVRHHAIHEPLV